MNVLTLGRTYATSGTLLGFKELLTTGSITQGSNSLQLSSNPGFQIGDSLIVELGGEAGAGMRGTKGVGGTWPSLSYVDQAAMIADSGQAANTFAWLESTGDTYRYTSGVWTIVSGYYPAKANPLALVATVTNVSGLTLTLNKTASVASTAAPIHFDNYPILNYYIALGSGATPTNNTLIIPSGRFAFSQRNWLQGHTGWTIYGQGGRDNSILFSPKGVPSFSLVVQASEGTLLRDFAYVGNVADNGFGLNPTGQTTLPAGEGYPSAIRFVQSHNSNAVRLRGTNVWQYAVGAASSNNVWATECEYIQTVPHQSYIQWIFLWSNSDGGGTIDCSIDSTYMVGGFEMFTCNGTSHIRPRGRNFGMSANCSGGFLYERPSIAIEAGSQYSENSWSKNNPLININSNQQVFALTFAQGGRVRNPSIVIEGYMNGSNDLPQGIVVNAANRNISISADSIPDGTIDYRVNWISGSSLGGPQGIVSDNAAIEVDGIRVKGTTQSASWPNIKAASGSIVRNCVADRISSTGVTTSGNQDNASWEASH